MKNRKTRRSRCANDTCGKQIPPRRSGGKPAPPACKTSVCTGIRRKAKQEEAERSEKYERMTELFGSTALAESERQASDLRTAGGGTPS